MTASVLLSAESEQYTFPYGSSYEREFMLQSAILQSLAITLSYRHHGRRIIICLSSIIPRIKLRQRLMQMLRADVMESAIDSTFQKTK